MKNVRVDGDIFENAPRVDEDLFLPIKHDAFSKISGYARTWPISYLHVGMVHGYVINVCLKLEIT